MIRYILLGFSALAALAVFVFWIVSGHNFDVVLFIVLAFLVANAFYVFISRPTVKTSDILARASNGLTIASLELQQRAQEAHVREVEAEERRRAEAEHDRYKLQVAKDILQHLRSRLPQARRDEINLPQITHQSSSQTGMTPLQPPAPAAADTVPPSSGREAVKRSVGPIGPALAATEARAAEAHVAKTA